MPSLVIPLLFILGIVSLPAMADIASARLLANKYGAFAKAINPSSTLSAEAGRAFYIRKILVHGRQVSCSSCHHDNPREMGNHLITDKPIKPLAPSVNRGRFTSLDKVEANFEKHCLDIIGRDCTAQEKGDFITYLISVK